MCFGIKFVIVMDINAVKKEFIDIYNANIRREGAGELLSYLCKTDFFNAPASSRFHGNYEGGLCEHSIHVYKRLKALVDMHVNAGDIAPDTVSEETIAICGLLHDLCKTNFYAVQYRNVKKDNVWQQVPYYTIQDSLPYGHGEKSVYIICGYMKLSRAEAMAINWHMGGFDNRVRAGDYSISDAYRQFPIAMLTHLADMTATYLDEDVIK